MQSSSSSCKLRQHFILCKGVITLIDESCRMENKIGFVLREEKKNYKILFWSIILIDFCSVSNAILNYPINLWIYDWCRHINKMLYKMKRRRRRINSHMFIKWHHIPCYFHGEEKNENWLQVFVCVCVHREWY